MGAHTRGPSDLLWIRSPASLQLRRPRETAQPKGFKAPLKGALGLTYGSFRVNPDKNLLKVRLLIL